MQQHTNPRKLLSEQDLADRLGIGIRTLKQARADGLIAVEPIELGPRIHRWTEDDFSTIVAAFPRKAGKVAEPPQLAAGKAKNGAKPKFSGVA